MKGGFASLCALASALMLLAPGCSKDDGKRAPETPRDDYVFSPITNACRLIGILENPAGESSAVTSMVLDVRGMTARDFRRELERFPGREVHLWMPGRHHWLLVGRASTNRVSLAAAMDALAFDEGCVSLPELFANYAGRREDI